jgi:hypothetical protein
MTTLTSCRSSVVVVPRAKIPYSDSPAAAVALVLIVR